jgi:predicted nucleotidyltransferase
MQRFIETVSDDGKRVQLSEAIAQRKPFRRFREAFADDRRLERQWHEFEVVRQRETIVEWLRSIGVEPANQAAKTYDPPPLPDLRNIMFAEVRRFVRFARDIPGVLRISLIGSLTTDKEFPKDIDVLVTVSDECDLTALAQRGRELNGHMSRHQAGAEVFLANQYGHYLGRTCPWRNCAPGHRTRCDAANCGLRPYLHDDLAAIRLQEQVIIHPPVLLWPDAIAEQNVPADVREQLIDQLAMDETR